MRTSALIIRILCAAILFLILAGVLVFTGCSKSKSVDDEEDTDKTPPTVITDLAVVSSTSQTAMLQWTTPTDHRDDGSVGYVDAYDLRVSFDSITAQNFDDADSIPAPGTLPAGQVQLWPVENLTPDSTHYFAIKSMDNNGNWSSISNCASVHCAPQIVVTFADPAIEQAVRDHINRPTGDIMSTDVDTVWLMIVHNAGVHSLAGMEYFTSLVVADFSVNEISDLSPLADLEHLSQLYVGGNQISDISPLTDMITLHQLHLNDNPISDISPLATTDSLQQLMLARTQVTDFSPLYDLNFLADIGFDEMDISDMSFVSHLKRPQILGLPFNQITSVEPLRNMITIEVLNIMQNQISDIAALSTLTNLREVRLINNQITDVAPLVNNPGIDSGDVIYLEGNPLSQYATDVEIPTMEARGVTVDY